MNVQTYQWIYLAVVLALANWPWLSQRCFLILECEKKAVWIRLLETLVLFVVAGLLGRLLEQRVMGNLSTQDWEFYWVSFFVFLVFTFPGFIYRLYRVSH